MHAYWTGRWIACNLAMFQATIIHFRKANSWLHLLSHCTTWELLQPPMWCQAYLWCGAATDSPLAPAPNCQLDFVSLEASSEFKQWKIHASLPECSWVSDTWYEERCRTKKVWSTHHKLMTTHVSHCNWSQYNTDKTIQPRQSHKLLRNFCSRQLRWSGNGINSFEAKHYGDFPNTIPPAIQKKVSFATNILAC